MERVIRVRPDPDNPYVHVYAGSGSDSQAEGLADRYARTVEGLQG